ncbi:MAG: TfoX family protein [Actinobacteria bacterium]|jgi:TfoX/Sxy family transcriptional regulator of competence genes|nr:MAG: TfoX family protein [Actinomycetota bacterium]
MPLAAFNEKHKETLDEMLLPIPGVKAGKMFGLPGYYVDGKLFACVWEDGVSLKVPPEVREELLAKRGVEPFVPMEGRPMKEWVLINRKNSRDYLKLEDAFVSAVEYVLSLPKKSPRKKIKR